LIPCLAGQYETLFVVLARQATLAGEIDSSESIPGLHTHLQTRALLSVLPTNAGIKPIKRISTGLCSPVIESKRIYCSRSVF
jgi:hypothetical protein